MAAVPALSRPGQTLGTGNDNAEFMEKFSGLVYATFNVANVASGLIRSMTLTSGDSYKFMFTGRADGKYHVASESILIDTGYMDTIKSKSKNIYADDPWLTSTFTPTIDKLKNHWDEASRYARILGETCARDVDQKILSTILGAAKVLEANKNFPNESWSYPGYTNTTAIATVNGANIHSWIREVAEVFDIRGVPKMGRYVILRSPEYYALTGETDLVNRDFSQSNGDYAQARLKEVAGFKIIVSDNMPKTNTAGTSDSAVNNTVHVAGEGYNVDWAPATDNQVGGLAFQSEVAASVKMADINVEAHDAPDRRGGYVLAEYIMGHNFLRPECAAWMKCANGTIV